MANLGGSIPDFERLDSEGEICLTDIISANRNGGYLHVNQFGELIHKLQRLMPPEPQDIRRKSPEERAERRARIAGAIGTLIEHADEISGLLELFGIKVPTLPKSGE